MRHLQTALKPFNPAADQAAFTHRQGGFQIICLCMEKDQLNLATCRFCGHAGRAARTGRGNICFQDQNFKCGDLAVFSIINRRAGPPVNHTHR